MHGRIDPRQPVVIGAGQLNQRVDQGAPGLEPTELMAEALRRAAADTGARDPGGVLAAADTVGVVHVLCWRYRDPARLVAPMVGATPVRTWYTGPSGNSPMGLLNRAAVAVADGDADLVLLCGGESYRTRIALKEAGERPGWAIQDDDVHPTWIHGDGTTEIAMWAPGEIALGIAAPVQMYPIFESALRAAAGRTLAEHEQFIAELWSRFSEVAAGNPDAWIRRCYSPDEIRTAGPGNRMVGYPYTKLLNSNSMVEQSAALIVCSAERARALGVPPERWVFPWAGTDANDTLFVTNRPSLHGSPAIRVAGRHTLAMAGLGVDDLTHVDLYSCFPSAVEVAANELGLGLDRPLTVTGGLSFAGGPWNDYVMHALATTTRLLREDPGARALVTANGGFLTKHALGVLGGEPPPYTGYRWASPQDEVDAAGWVDAADGWDGPVTVEGYTVMHARDGSPENGIAACRTPDGRRTWGTTQDAAQMARMLDTETVGAAATVDGGALHLD